MNEELQKILLLLSQQETTTLSSLATTLAVALGCGLAIYLIYRFFYRGVVYSENFAVLIIIVSGITAFVIVTIGTNLVLSLGMVGALSIVRFRAPVKDPLDVGFLYWSIAAGLTAGARLYMVAIFGTGVVGLAYILMTLVRNDGHTFLLILRYAAADEPVVKDLLRAVRHKLKNRTTTAGNVELTLEVRVRRGNTDFMRALTDCDRVASASLVEYNGNFG